ncbi:MAG: nicotinate-nucleotide adenylyltransferase [Desulfobacterota bacterium]|nr:nicotinate-nucleotide adenylyltransferase [Thermodesulfobacteriota bacterium]
MKGKSKGKKVGLFGGTFNPIHLGHLRGAEEIREGFGLDEVIFIPSANPPHKPPEEILDARHRVEMVRLAISSNPFFSLSEIELKRPGKSYTIDTLRHFCGEGSDDHYFIMGGEAFGEIETWKDYKELFVLSHFIVMLRHGCEASPDVSALPETLRSEFRYDLELKAWVHPSGKRLYFREISFLDISSTKVRELIERGASVRYLIPPEAEAYLRKHALYRKEG